VRYGNVLGSRGSVLPLFLKQRETGVVTITDPRMTRFWLTMEHAVWFVLRAVETMLGGELYVPKIPSMTMQAMASALAPNCRQEIVGIRPGEKLHEQMIGEEDAYHTYEYPEHYKILPAIHQWDRDGNRIKDGTKVPEGFSYTSDRNQEWMEPAQLRAWIEQNRDKIGSI
jgi:FlaA1/EpsC-like NDP-sugar epimerase